MLLSLIVLADVDGCSCMPGQSARRSTTKNRVSHANSFSTTSHARVYNKISRYPLASELRPALQLGRRVRLRRHDTGTRWLSSDKCAARPGTRRCHQVKSFGRTVGKLSMPHACNTGSQRSLNSRRCFVRSMTHATARVCYYCRY